MPFFCVERKDPYSRIHRGFSTGITKSPVVGVIVVVIVVVVVVVVVV